MNFENFRRLLAMSLVIRIAEDPSIAGHNTSNIAFQEVFPHSNTTQAEIGNFTFSAEASDASAFYCRVNATGVDKQTLNIMQPNSAVSSMNLNLGRWIECSSPFTVFWITEGTFTANMIVLATEREAWWICLSMYSFNYHPQVCQVSTVQLKNCIILKIIMAKDSLESFNTRYILQ